MSSTAEPIDESEPAGPFHVPDAMDRVGAAADEWKGVATDLRAVIANLEKLIAAVVAKL